MFRRLMMAALAIGTLAVAVPEVRADGPVRRALRSALVGSPYAYRPSYGTRLDLGYSAYRPSYRNHYGYGVRPTNPFAYDPIGRRAGWGYRSYYDRPYEYGYRSSYDRPYGYRPYYGRLYEDRYRSYYRRPYGYGSGLSIRIGR